ncbi:hypothetical protein V5N11_003130 [Cardamine amara subsp. amara]|uniref:Uncharacterized protein n=1 Tax=Cardamine amara subsp. amara TaxID=228776 RepID=A0ABD0ZL81_CARAN
MDTRNTTGLCRDSPIMIDENEVMDAEDSEGDKQEKSENSNKSENLAKDKNEPVLVNTDTCIGRDAESASKQKSEGLQDPTERVYKPKIPFPRNPRKSKQELYEAKCRAILEKLTVEIPLMDAIKTTPVVKRCLKRMLTTDMSQDESVMMISEVCSAVIQNRIPEKLEDPESFVLDCSIFEAKFKGSLCDLGSSVSLMP